MSSGVSAKGGPSISATRDLSERCLGPYGRPPNKRMQLTALQVKGTLDSVQSKKSPQLMRGPLGAPQPPSRT